MSGTDDPGTRAFYRPYTSCALMEHQGSSRVGSFIADPSDPVRVTRPNDVSYSKNVLNHPTQPGPSQIRPVTSPASPPPDPESTHHIFRKPRDPTHGPRHDPSKALINISTRQHHLGHADHIRQQRSI